jgi:hypothetical protein
VSAADPPIVEPVTFEPADDVTFTPEEWETRVANVAAVLDSNGLTESDLRQALAEVLFTDSERRVWFYDSTAWFCQNGEQWTPSQPAGPLWLRPWTMQWMVMPDGPDDPLASATAGPATATTAFTPTHRIGPDGLATWPSPDAAAPPGPPVAGGLEVQVSEARGDWAEIVCSNGWSAWVDHRRLIPL